MGEEEEPLNCSWGSRCERVDVGGTSWHARPNLGCVTQYICKTLPALEAGDVEEGKELLCCSQGRDTSVQTWGEGGDL